jgi:DNA-binding GntR family transcriptional regulator
MTNIGEAAQEGLRDVFFELNLRFHTRQFAFAGNAPVQAVYLEHAHKLLLLRRRSF